MIGVPQFLETVMLVCFGVSWPISLYKNVKSRTAVGTSLAFIVMIIVGYLAGITAKILSGSTGYVLVAYVLNIMMVTANLFVYFRNRALDRQKDGLQHKAA